MPLSPEWAKLPKRHCDDCGKLYKPVKPSRPGEHYFCSDNCRKSFHKHGGAYRKLKLELERMVRRDYAKRLQMEEPCELCQGKGIVPSGQGARRPRNLLLPKQPSDTCPKCINGAVLTTFGREVLDFVQR